MEIHESSNLEQDVIQAVLPGMRAIQRRVDDAVYLTTPVDSGDLINSYESHTDPVTGVVTVEFTEDYALPVEVGHETEDGSYVQGQRFLLRALRIAELGDHRG